MKPWLAFALTAGLLAGCTSHGEREGSARIERLKTIHDQLRERFDRAAANEPLVASALSDPGQVILAIRSGLVEELAGNIASRYLDRVTVDLGKVHARSSGKLERKTFLGRVDVGKWKVRIDLGQMIGLLRAGQPRVGLRPPDLIDVDLPVDVMETAGNATVHFEWDSAGVANLVCNDFELTLAIQGRVLPQRHTLSGALRVSNTGDRLVQTPLFPERRIALRMDLTPPSWAAVEKALRSEDKVGKCGMFMNPDDALASLRTLAAKGVSVQLPASIFRTVNLPARLQESVTVNKRPVGLGLTALTLRVDTATLWSSASVQVQRSDQR